MMIAEFIALSGRSLELRKKKVSNKLKERNIDENIVQEVIDLVEDDDCMKAMHQLNTSYKRDQYIEKHFEHNPPREIILNPKEVRLGKPKDSFQYISVIDGIRILFQDKTFLQALEIGRNSFSSEDNEILREVRDGQMTRNLSFLKHNPEAYIGLLYSDAVEITSPLAAGKGRNKILQMFWTIGDLPKQFRSKVDQIQVCIIVKDQILKKYGYGIIYQPLIDDLKVLESGIIVDLPVCRKIKVCFPLHLGDNLESHSLGGWSTCFSSKDICRTCHVQYEDLETRIHNYTANGPHSYWSIDEYDKIVRNLADSACNDSDSTEQLVICDDNLFTEIEDPMDTEDGAIDIIVAERSEDDSDQDFEDESESSPLESVHGLRSKCPLNCLQAFHAVNSFPQDSLHDVLEGSNFKGYICGWS